MNGKLFAALTIAVFLMTPAAGADQGRCQLERSGEGFVRLDTETGEISICTRQASQLVCRAAAEERAAFQSEIDRLDSEIEALKRRVSELEIAPPRSGELPSDEEFERTLGFMEKFMRRFMDMIEEFERAPENDETDMPDRT